MPKPKGYFVNTINFVIAKRRIAAERPAERLDIDLQTQEAIQITRTNFSTPKTKVVRVSVDDKGEGKSLADLVSDALQKIRELSESSRNSDKLQALNILLFVFVTGLAIDQYLGGIYQNPISAGAFVLVSLLFSFIISLGYTPILGIVVNLTSHKVEGLRAGIWVEIVALTVAIAGLILGVGLISGIALVLVAVQVLIMPIGGSLLPSEGTETKVESSGFWLALGRMSTLLSIVGFFTDLVLALIKYLGH